MDRVPRLLGGGLGKKMISAWNFGNYYGMFCCAAYFRVRFEIERTPDAD